MSQVLDDETDVDARRVLRRAISRPRERQSRHLSDDRLPKVSLWCLPIVLRVCPSSFAQAQSRPAAADPPSTTTPRANFATTELAFSVASAVFLFISWRRVT